MRKLLPAILVFALPLVARAQVPPEIAQNLRTFDTPHYIIHTDLDDASTREADLRMTKMFEEYQRRTAGFSGQVNGKFPFYLFKDRDEYYASGAPPQSIGVFMRDAYGSRLMAVAGEQTTFYTWHVVQHEGFHQFANAVIRGELPIWLNEGMAEYFGEALFTGDSFVSGLIPPDRLKRIKEEIHSHAFKPFSTMLAMSHQQWNVALTGSNYDQAWAMVHFLANADNGRYQPALVQYFRAIGNGNDATAAWNSVFGSDTSAFQDRCEKWWLDLPEQPTRSGYVKATVMIMTSFLSRAYLEHQTFKNMNDYLEHFDPAKLPTDRNHWLPPKLYEAASDAARRVGKWTLDAPAKGLPRITMVDDDGSKYVCQFTLAMNRIDKVWADVTPAPAK